MPAQALILAGGLGTRFRAVREDLPKPLAPIAGRSVLQRQLQALEAAGIERAILCVGHRGSEIKDIIGQTPTASMRVDYSYEPEPLGTGGAIAHARDNMAPNDFLVLNGDTLMPELDYSAMLATHQQSAATATIAVVPAPADAASGGLQVQRGRITAFQEKQRVGGSEWTNGGAYVFSPAAWPFIRQPSSLEYDVFPAMLAGGAFLAAHPYHGFFGDMGTLDGYRRVVAHIEKGRVNHNEA